MEIAAMKGFNNVWLLSSVGYEVRTGSEVGV